MTNQEIEKEINHLKDVLGKDYEVKQVENFIVVDKVAWNNVEFVECIMSYDGHTSSITKGQIYKVAEYYEDRVVYLQKDELGWGSDKFKPSNESAYVEQLKAKAHDLYGDIKKGDVFDQSPFNEDKGKFKVERDQIKFSYDKWSDSLYVNGVTLYRGGKWATRINEPIRVNISGFTLSNPYSTIVFTTSHRIKDGQVDVKEFMNHIEESIEAFLNRKP